MMYIHIHGYFMIGFQVLKKSIYEDFNIKLGLSKVFRQGELTIGQSDFKPGGFVRHWLLLSPCYGERIILQEHRLVMFLEFNQPEFGLKFFGLGDGNNLFEEDMIILEG